MPITRTPIINDDLSGTTGTILDNAWKQELYNQIDAFVGVVGGVEVLTVTAAGAVALNPAAGVHIVYCAMTGAAFNALTFTGGSAAQNERLLVMNAKPPASTGVVTIAHAAGVLNNIATSAPTPIAPGGSATYVRIAGQWFLTAHEQGAWITPPYSAANFTASGGTWTVEPGDVAAMQYKLSGLSLLINFVLSTTTVTAGTAYLQILNGAWGGFTIAAGAQVASPTLFTPEPGSYVLAAGSTPTFVYLFRFSNVAYAAATNSLSQYGQMTIPVI